MKSQNRAHPGNFDYTKSGNGPPIIFLHGWPFNKETYRKVIPFIEPYYTCYNLNSLGMSNGGAECLPGTMDFPDHAARVVAFADEMGLQNFSLFAHDTGGTIARIVAANQPTKITKLVLLNTEIPFHRPPFVPEYQRMFKLPGSSFIVKMLLKSKMYRHSLRGYGGCFYDRKLIDGEFTKLFVEYFISDRKRFEGLRQYLMQLDFNIVDTIDDIHARIIAPTQYIWGRDDTTFPSQLGSEMAKKMTSCKEFIEVENTCFLPHEEKPEFVAKNAIRFLGS